MRFFFILVLFFSLFSNSLLAQVNPAKKETGEFYYPIIQNNLYGYINYSGDVVVPAIFQWCDYFYEGLAAAQKNGKYGFINPRGEWKIAAEFDSVRNFSEGFAAVGVRGNDSTLYWSFVDATGKALNLNLIGICNAVSFHNNRGAIFLCGGSFNDYYFIDRNGKIIFKPDGYYLDDSRVSEFHEGFMRVILPDNSRTFVDTMGKFWGKGTYEDVGNFKEDFAWYQENGMYGFINKEGAVVIPAQFEAVRDFSEGKAKTIEKQKLDVESQRFFDGIIGYINSTGKYLASPQYEEGGDYHDGFALVKLGGFYGFLDANGSAAIDFQYTDAKSFFRGLAFVKVEKHWQYINTSGRKVW